MGCPSIVLNQKAKTSVFLSHNWNISSRHMQCYQTTVWAVQGYTQICRISVESVFSLSFSKQEASLSKALGPQYLPKDGLLTCEGCCAMERKYHMLSSSYGRVFGPYYEVRNSDQFGRYRLFAVSGRTVSLQDLGIPKSHLVRMFVRSR